MGSVNGFDLYSKSDSWIYTMSLHSSTFQYVPSVINISDSTVTWSKAISYASGSVYAFTAYSGYDGTYIHAGFPLQLNNNYYGVYVILEQSTGNLYGSIKQVSSSHSLFMLSLNVDSNNVSWIESCTIQGQSPTVCEIIKYDRSSDSFTNYQVTNIAFKIGFVDASNGNYIRSQSLETRESNIDLFNTTLTTSTTSGISDANSSFSIESGSLSNPSFTTTTWTVSSTSTPTTLNYTRTDTIFSRSSSGDDGLSGGAIAGIVIGAVLGAILICLSTVCGIILCAKKGWLCFSSSTQAISANPVSATVDVTIDKVAAENE